MFEGTIWWARKVTLEVSAPPEGSRLPLSKDSEYPDLKQFDHGTDSQAQET